jgi:signal transduction histidine kinase
MERNQTFVSNLSFGPVVQRSVIHISRPVMEDGRPKYTLHLVMQTATLASTLEIGHYSQGKIVSVADRDDRIVARSLNADRFIGHPISSTIREAVHQRLEGTTDSVTLEGIPVLTAFSHTKAGWVVLIGAPKASLYASARQLLWLGLLSSAALTVVALLMVRWIGNALLHSMDTLASNAATLRDGHMPPATSLALSEPEFVAEAMRRTAATLLDRTRTLEVLNRVSGRLVAERDARTIVQLVTDAAAEATRARFAAFIPPQGATAGAPYYIGGSAEAFQDLGMLPTALVQSSSFAQGVIRSASIASDPRFQVSQQPHAPHVGPSVQSLLAAPVLTPSGTVIGGIFLADPSNSAFSASDEKLIVGLAAQAAVAVENAALYARLAEELAAKTAIEGELRQAHQGLERTVQERTVSLREAIVQMEEFSYTVSHDLRSPLRAVRAYAEALEEDNGAQLDENGHEYLRRIKRATTRMERLTHDLLSYSRLANTVIELTTVDLDVVVRGIIEHYPDLNAAKIQVRSPLGAVTAYEPFLTQAVANLLTNAGKFTKPGRTVAIAVWTERRGRSLRLWVQDDGIGIDRAQQARLFIIFERAPNAASYPGTGVGLAIVRRAMEKIGGTYGVESDGVTGSRFWIELPEAG